MSICLHAQELLVNDSATANHQYAQMKFMNENNRHNEKLYSLIVDIHQKNKER